MSKYTDNVNSPKDILYNNVLLLSRNITFYTKFDLIDTFQNRINLIFIHISFLFIQMKNNNKENLYKSFYQNLFDLVFKYFLRSFIFRSSFVSLYFWQFNKIL